MVAYGHGAYALCMGIWAYGVKDGEEEGVRHEWEETVH